MKAPAVKVAMRFVIDQAAVTAMATDPDGIVREGVQRAADIAAGRLREHIVAEGLIDTGAMLAGVTTEIVETGPDGVVAEVGTPVPYGIYHPRPFRITLDEVRASDTDT